MHADVGNRIDYMVMIVFEYALSFGLTPKTAFAEISSSGGLATLEDNYEIEHTLPISSTIDALAALAGRAR